MIQRYLSISSLILGCLTILYSSYILVAYTSGYNRSYTDKEFLSSFFMGIGIVVFGLFIEVKQEDVGESKYLKGNKKYRLIVLLSLFLFCLAGTLLSIFKL